MKLSELYSEYFANWVSGGALVIQDRISLLGLKPLFDRFITHNWITKIWVVKGFPVEYDLNLTDLVRGELFKLDPKVRTMINFVSIPTNINARNSIFLKQFETASQNFHEMEDYFNSLTREQRVAGVAIVNPNNGKKIYITEEHMKNAREEYQSFLYIYEQVMGGHVFTNTYYFIQASARNKKEMKKFTRDIASVLDSQGIIFSELHGNIGEYLDNFCPAVYTGNGVNHFTSNLMSDENLAGLMPYKTLGLIGGKGLLMGVDKRTGLPFLLDFFNSGTAQINMILGKTGCGKTFAAFAVALGLLGLGLHISVVDIKGGEWCRLKAFAKTLVIGMGNADSKFINTLRMDDMECMTEDEAMDVYNTAVRGTTRLFEIAVNLQENEGNVMDLQSILNRAVKKVFSKVGVVAGNVVTYSGTESLKFSDVIDVVTQLQLSSSYTEQQKLLCQLIVTRTSDFFLPQGRYADAFKNELTLKDVLESEVVIYDFNKNTDVMLDTLDTLRVFMVQFLDGKKQSFRKRKKQHTGAFYEELQRCEQFGLLVDEISHKVTGSRSSNVIIFLLLNSVTTFDSSAFAAIKSNITTKIIGKMNGEDVEKLVNEFDCAPIRDYMTAVCNDQTGDLKHCFAVQYDTGADTNKVLIETVMPKEMGEHFNTRDRMPA